jgi:anaerobic dimethyl sulfoxide reductase subunit B (iron-sulfur subunit)
MANTPMAIVQDIDKCMRCNGCVITCKRTWQLKGMEPVNDLPNQKISINQRLVIKPQKRVDTAPFVRFSCWHCAKPPCTARCPWGAIKKDAGSGAVYIDQAKCDPDKAPACNRVCKQDCQRGGYIRIGKGTDAYPGLNKAQKCTMCFGRAGDTLTSDLPSKSLTSQLRDTDSTKYPEMKHQPACVYTCPAKAMYYDTRANAIRYIQDGLVATGSARIISAVGDGNIFWFSRKYSVTAPKADPFMEDHVAPMVSSLLSTPFAKAALVPTLVAGGLFALSARRAQVEAETMSLTGGES